MGSYTVLDTPCREWQGYRNTKAYGRRSSGGRLQYVHRWVWEQINGPIPDGMCVLHRCDNPPCFRYDHLFLGTRADNNADMKAKGRTQRWLAARTHCKNGHEYTPENTRISTRYGRCCRACAREWTQRRRSSARST